MRRRALPFGGWRRPRRASGWSVLLLIGAAFSCFSALALIVWGVPYSWQQARQLRALPRPDAAEWATLAPGTRALFVAQLPIDAAVDAHGLALAYTETRATTAAEGATTTTWQRSVPPPAGVTLDASPQRRLTVQLPQDARFANAQELEETPTETAETLEVRHVGFLPGQTLTIEGVWEGDDRITAAVLFAGSPDAYLTEAQQQPGQSLLTGVICGGVGLIVLGVAAVARLMGR